MIISVWRPCGSIVAVRRALARIICQYVILLSWKNVYFSLQHTILNPTIRRNDYLDFHSDKILLFFSTTCTRDRSRHIFKILFTPLNIYVGNSESLQYLLQFKLQKLKMWLDHYICYRCLSLCSNIVPLYIILRAIRKFFQNENRDNCWHVSLELEAVVFDKKRRGGEPPHSSTVAHFSYSTYLYYQCVTGQSFTYQKRLLTESTISILLCLWQPSNRSAVRTQHTVSWT